MCWAKHVTNTLYTLQVSSKTDLISQEWMRGETRVNPGTTWLRQGLVLTRICWNMGFAKIKRGKPKEKDTELFLTCDSFHWVTLSWRDFTGSKTEDLKQCGMRKSLSTSLPTFEDWCFCALIKATLLERGNISQQWWKLLLWLQRWWFYMILVTMLKVSAKTSNPVFLTE